MHSFNKHFLPPIMRQEPGGTEVSMLHHLTTRSSGSVSISAPVGSGVVQDTWVSGLPDERPSPSRRPHLISPPFPHHDPSSRVRLHPSQLPLPHPALLPPTPARVLPSPRSPLLPFPSPPWALPANSCSSPNASL